MATRDGQDFAFTEYVRALDGAGPPDRSAFAAAWGKLRRMLKSELRRRSLSTAPPAFLGIYGYESWHDEQDVPLHELTHDAFTAIFVDRLTYLRDLLRELDHVEGIAYRTLRNFLYDRQKRNDPLGFRVFDVLRAATRRSIERQVLYVLAGDPRVRNSTVLGFAPETDPAAAHGTDLGEAVAAWGGELLPELVTAPPQKLETVTETLCAHLEGLQARGRAFRFRDLIGPFKDDVRKRWFSGFRNGEAESASALERPGAGFEQRQRFQWLIACVEETLPQLAARRRTFEHLRSLWTFLKIHVAASGAGALPSDRQLAERLAVPRKKIPKLMRLLGASVEKCRERRELRPRTLTPGPSPRGRGGSGTLTPGPSPRGRGE
ncbi:MAG TPA: hypothetical protein VGG06_29780 [Thermoanaerobaculia bacterium]|jgi:hypothetical protein